MAGWPSGHLMTFTRINASPAAATSATQQLRGESLAQLPVDSLLVTPMLFFFKKKKGPELVIEKILNDTGWLFRLKDQW